jgi:integrase
MQDRRIIVLEINNGKSWRCQWKETQANGKRITQRITLGSTKKLSRSAAMKHHDMIMSIIGTVEQGQSFDRPQQTWLVTIPEKLHGRLERLGLVRERAARRSQDEFSVTKVREEYQQSRDVKSSTLANENRAFDHLEEFFGADMDVREINAARAKAFAGALPKARVTGTKKLATSTVSGLLKKVDGLFNYLVDSEFITKNPFRTINKSMKRDPSKDHYVTIQEARDYIDAVEHPQWKAIMAIARYCGIRGPSDVLFMKRKHINFETNTVTFPSLKTGNRNCPMFPEVVEHLQWLCDREADAEGYLFKDTEQGGHGKKGNWEAVRASGNLKDLNLRKTPNDSYHRLTGKDPLPKLFKNCRATRVTELIKVYGKTQHSVCNWIGHTKQIEDEHYLMMMEEDHKHAVGIVTDPKVGDKIGDSTPITQQSTVLSDDVLQRVIDTTEAEALAENTLVLKELTTLLASTPDAASLLLSAISAKAKKPQSSSNRGRTCTPEGTGS